MKDGKPVSKNRVYQLRDGLFEAIIDRFYKDPTLVAYGEENRDWGGAFAVYRGLTEALPYHRLFNAPISEAAIVGTAVGYAMAGGRALVELMYCDFLGRAGDEVFNQMAKWQAMSAGMHQDARGAARVRGFQVRRAALSGLDRARRAHSGPQGRLPGHAVRRQGPDGYAALAGTDPVVFFESQRIYDIGEHVPRGRRAGGATMRSPIGKPDVKQRG